MGKSVSESEGYQHESSGYTLSPRIAYEFHQWYKRISLHHGTDVITSFSRYSHESIYENPTNNRSTVRKDYSVGLRPLIGMTFYINKSISVSTKTYMEITYNKMTRKEVYNENPGSEETQGMNIGMGPLGIVSLNLHF